MTRAALLLLLLSACRSGQRDVAAEVKAAAAEFDAAQLHGDRETLDRYLAADFVFVRGSGAVTNRKAFIDAFTSPTQKLDPFVITSPILLELGENVALVGGDAVLSGTESGKRFTERIRYADIFSWRDGRWQVVYVQVTRL